MHVDLVLTAAYQLFYLPSPTPYSTYNSSIAIVGYVGGDDIKYILTHPPYVAPRCPGALQFSPSGGDCSPTTNATRLFLFFRPPLALQFWTLRTRLANPASASMVPVASRDRALVNRRQTHRLLASQQPIGEQFTDTLRLNMVALNPIEDVTRMEATRPPQCHPVTYHCIFNTAGEDDFPAPQQILGS